MFMYDESIEVVDSPVKESRTSPDIQKINQDLKSNSVNICTKEAQNLVKNRSIEVNMKADGEPSATLKNPVSNSPGPLEPLKGKMFADKRVPTKKPDLPGQEPSDEDEDDEEEESEYQSNRLAQIEGTPKFVRSHRKRLPPELNDDDYDDLLTFGVEEDSFKQFTLDELSRYMALNTLVTEGNLDLYPHPPSLPYSPEEVKLVQNNVHEVELNLKRNDLKSIAKYTCNPGIHREAYRMYRAEDYEHLNTTQEIKELFEYISRYSPPPTASQVDVKMKPFIPEFYPSVGDIDAFLKVIHPEIGNDNLGIKVLDEPCAFQSDPSVLDLRLRAMAKQSSARAVVVKKVENVGKNAKVIDNWIKDISDLHRAKPSPSIHYSKPMPDIDQLLQEWPQGFEGLLASTKLPPPELDCDLKTYVDLVCNILDIPVYKSRIQSLHVLATLYLAHKSFGNYAIGGAASGKRKENSGMMTREDGGNIGNATHENGIDRLELE